jgi:hypothetical protein
MSQIQFKDIPIQKETDIKEESNQLLAASRLANYAVDREKEFKQFSGLLDNTLRNTYNFTRQQEESLKLIQETSKADAFRNQFTPEKVDEEMDAYAKEAGFESRGKIYFGRNDQLVNGFMGHSAASDAGSMFSGNFELISSSQTALRNKTQMMGSNALLSKSKAWPSIQKEFELVGPDKDEYLRQLEIDNNWERTVNIDSFESLAKAIPVVDPLFTMISGKTPEEQYLKRKDPSFNGRKIVEEIQKSDPEFAAFLRSEGVNFDDLAQADNPFHFRWLLNSTVQANALNRSLQSSEKYHSAPVNWALFGYNQAYHSLTSGDFVGQVVLTAATAGLGAAVAGIATVVNGLTATSRVKGALAASQTAINIARAGKTVRELRNWIPSNIPSTLVHKFTPNGLSFGKSTAGTFGIWVTGQAIEGFVEEGVTDVVNQIYEKNIGTRLGYNYSQMFDAAVMGSVMQPILGGALQVATIPINFTVSFAGKTGSTVAEGLFTYAFKLDSGRVREFRLYLDEFMGNFESLSPEEQQTRIGMITAGLATEAALNEATGQAFGKLESEENQFLLGQLMSMIGNDHQLAGDPSGRLLLSELAVKLAKLRADLNGANGQGTARIETEEQPTADDVGRGYIGFEEKPGNKFLVFSRGPNLADVTKIPYTKAMEQVFTIENGNLVFTRNGAELMLVALIVDSQSTSEAVADNVTEMITFIGRNRLVEKVKKENPNLNKKELTEEEQEQLDEKVLTIIEAEGETDFTRIMEEINSAFEVIRQLDLNPREEITSTVDIQVDPEIAKKISTSRKQTRDRFNKQEEAEIGVPPLLARPTEEEMMPSKPWSMMDEVTPVESSTTSEIVPAAPEAAPAAPEAAPAAPEAAPVITPTPTTTVLDADSIKAKLASLDPVLLNALKNARKC